LKNGISFVWDETTQKAFDALKYMNRPLLNLPDYHRDYFLYLVVLDVTISLVLVQEDELNTEHVIYYLSRGLTKTEIKYAHVERLALEVVQVVQKLCHYILFHKTTIFSDYNPMVYILTRQLIGGKYSKWIVILQEFDL